MSRSIVSAIVLAAALAAPVSAAARSCTVAAVEGGDARYWLAGTWSALKPSMTLSDNSKVATGPDSRARIICDDGSVIAVGTGTEVNLDELVAPGGGLVFQLIDGIVGLLVPRPSARPIEVRTPVAIASVRSTEWLVEFAPREGAAVFVRAGRVAVRSKKRGRASLGVGEGVSVTESGDIGPVKTWGAPRIAKSTARLGFDWR